MRRRLALAATTLALTLLAGPGCVDVGDPWYQSAEVALTVPSGPLSFDADVLPIFSRRGCITCHAAGGGGEVHFDITSAAAIARGGDDDPQPAVPCDSANSLLVEWITSCYMPYDGGPCLNDVEIATVAKWIDQGATQTYREGTCPNPPLD